MNDAYCARQLNVVKGWVNAVFVRSTFNHVYLTSSFDGQWTDDRDRSSLKGFARSVDRTERNWKVMRDLREAVPSFVPKPATFSIQF